MSKIYPKGYNGKLNVHYVLWDTLTNDLLTEDGLLIDKKIFSSIKNVEDYKNLLDKNKLYDYDKSVLKGELIVSKKNTTVPTVESLTSESTVSAEDKEMTKLANMIADINNNATDKVIEPVETKKLSKPTATKKHSYTKKATTVKPTVESKVKVEVSKPKTKFNGFDFFAPYIALLTTITCSGLSIYFTGMYLTSIQTIVIAFIYSSILLVFELVGSQFAQIYFKKGKRFTGCILTVITAIVTLFSMYSALETNYKKYIENHASVVAEKAQVGKNTNNYKLIESDIADNKETIAFLKSENETLSHTYIRAWSDKEGGIVVLEGQLAQDTKDKMAVNTAKINELTEKNNELKSQMRELVNSGVSDEVADGASNTDTATLSDLFSKIINVNANIIQMIIMLVPSAFVDLISILSLTIYRDMKKED